MQDEVLIAGFGRRGHAVGDIPGVRFKVRTCALIFRDNSAILPLSMQHVAAAYSWRAAVPCGGLAAGCMAITA